MNIHHAIVKSAAAKGVILTVDQDGNPSALVASMNTRVTLDAEGIETQAEFNELAKDAWANAQDVADYNAVDAETDKANIVRIEQDGFDFVAYDTTTMGSDDAPAELARDPVLADLLETITEMMENGDLGGVSDDTDEDDERQTANVVPVKYKQKYAAEGHPDHCGDWLATTLNALCHKLVSEGGKGKTLFDLDSMIAINDANGLETEKYTRKQTRGWEGRYRMTTRNMLAKVVAAAGVLYVPDGVGGEGDRELTAPAEWCAKFAPKPKAPASSKKEAKA